MKKPVYMLVIFAMLCGIFGVANPAFAGEADHTNAEHAEEHGVEMFDPSEVLSLQAYRLPASSSGKPQIAMTLDDGTSAVTNYILDGLERLAREGIDLSDLVITWCINAREPVAGTIQRILDAGHAICSHGYRHLNLTTLSCSEIRETILGVEDFVNARVRRPIDINSYRPPWGATNSRVQECTDGIGYEW